MITKTFVRRCLLLGALLAGSAGCYTTRVHTGLPGAGPSLMASDRWHHTIVAGIAEISDPVDLETACPGGWSTINEEYSFLNGLVGGVTWGIYTPRTYTVICGSGGGAPAPGWGAPGAPPPGAGWGAPPPGAPPAPTAPPPPK
jgi:Bor protein